MKATALFHHYTKGSYASEFIAKIIGTHEHESHFVFDLLYNNTSGIKPTRHSTDTHGADQVNFLCSLTAMRATASLSR